MVRQAHIVVTGKVQGVFYRHHAHKKATELGLTGRICNLEDLSVEIIAEGEEEPISLFIEWCHEGPPAAEVDDVAVDFRDGVREFSDFRIINWEEL